MRDEALPMPMPDDRVDREVADMRLLLQLLRGASATESLRALRAAFPYAGLAARTAAIAGGRGL